MYLRGNGFTLPVILLFCLSTAAHSAEDALKALSDAFQDLRAAPVVSLHGWNNTKRVAYVYEREVKATTDSASMKGALADFLSIQKWTYRPDLGEPIATGAAVHLYFKNSKGQSIRLSILAYNYIVLGRDDDSAAPSLWFSINGKADLNTVFWLELFEKHAKEWKVEKIERRQK